MEYILNLKAILLWFELISGLRINYHKSEMIPLGKGDWDISELANGFGCRIGSFPTKYLGMQLGVSPRRLSTWDPILERIRVKLSSWKRKHLSFGGRITLLNSVISALPLYYMSMFKMPKGIIKKIDETRRQFLWGGTEDKRKLCKVAWENVCKPKAKGGLGIINLEVQNRALLAKWSWRYAKEPSALWRKIIATQYGRATQSWIPNRDKIRTTSPVWRDIINDSTEEDMKKVIGEDSFVWRLGNGKSILFWFDPWLLDKGLKDLYPRLFLLAIEKRAKAADYAIGESFDHEIWASFFRRQLREWELQMLQEIQAKCRSLKLSVCIEDKLVWKLNSTGQFSVKAAAQAIMSEAANHEDFDLKIVWKLKIPANVQAFMWLLALEKVASKVFLIQRGIAIPESDLICAQCKSEIEDTNHIFLFCPIASESWERLARWWNITIPQTTSIGTRLRCLAKMKFPDHVKERWWTAIASISWTLWLARNEATFGNKCGTVSDIEFLVKMRFLQWLNAEKSRLNPHIQDQWWHNPTSNLQSFPLTLQPDLQYNNFVILSMAFFYPPDCNHKIGMGGVLMSSKSESLAFILGFHQSPLEQQPEAAALLKSINKLTGWLTASNSFLQIQCPNRVLIQNVLTTEDGQCSPESMMIRNFLLQRNMGSLSFACSRNTITASKLALEGYNQQLDCRCFWFNSVA